MPVVLDMYRTRLSTAEPLRLINDTGFFRDESCKELPVEYKDRILFQE